MIKNQLKLAYKKIRFNFFFKIYGHIKSIVSVFENKNFIVKKIKVNLKEKYNIYILKNCKIFSTTVNDTAYIKNNFLIKEPSYQFRINKKKLVKNAKITSNFVIKNGTPSFLKKINGTVVSLLSGGASKANYWHWLMDTVLKIALLEKKKLIKKSNYYLVPSLSKKFQLETLLPLGIQKNRILNSEKFKHIEAKEIICTDHPIVFNNNPTKSILDIPIWSIKWLRKKYLSKKYSNKKNNRKIYIDRVSGINLNNRKIKNDFEVKRILEKLGFEIIRLEEYSFLDQVYLFSSAKVIVGVHGAAFTNIIFSRPGTKIVEIQSNFTGNQYKNLARKCHLNYFRIIEKNLSSKLKFQNFFINVNINKLKKIVL